MKTWQVVAGSTVAGLALAASAVVTAGPWESGQRTAEQARAAAGNHAPGDDGLAARAGLPAPAPSAGAVLRALTDPARGGAAPGRAERDAALAKALAPLMDAPALGNRPAALVIDVTGGAPLYSVNPDAAMTPASTVKIATAAAVLAAVGPEHRIATTVVPGGAPGEIVLVGGGDPSLTARRGASGGSLIALAADTARALQAAGTTTVTLGWDAGRFTGPDRHPIGVNPNLARISALTVDEARTDGSSSGPVERLPDPAAAAAKTFADLLRARGLTVTGEPAARPAPAGAKPMATTLSPPVGALVERMLTNSDNDFAEALARLTAVSSGQPASFEGVAKATAARIAGLGLDTAGSRFADGSGLDRADKVTVELLTGILAKAAAPDRAGLRPLLSGLPVAGFSGTLKARNAEGSPAAGLVRAKTGTLTGVNALSGIVATPSGRLLAFAFLAADTPAAGEAEKALDALAAEVAAMP
ncbi:D-alanyl-D-alanine carboxypeptidase/D-alanyl-D-alanine endopeptidase [Streptomyces sp. BI20]|uniref:D-alanyl-D-alanine carboxypeptidase/D-alanyl-D-alanine endopeptidase n=1 Tax=Streptomyces sp. BI20 TaxID=3403460 RepID=UPI003C75D0B1